MTDYLTTLMRYKAWANELVFGAVAKLPEAELVAPRKIVFGNLLRTLNHVYAMDEVWRAHLEGRPHGYTTRNPEACPPLAELREAQRAMDAWWVDYADALPEAKQDEVVSFR
ncbi:MAG: DinB family protein, partial [Burkholderiales bacterium]